MPDEQAYLLKLNQVLKEVHMLCLGQETKFHSVLPEHMKNAPREAQAEHIAEQLVFSVASLCKDVFEDEVKKPR